MRTKGTLAHAWQAPSEHSFVKIADPNACFRSRIARHREMGSAQTWLHCHGNSYREADDFLSHPMLRPLHSRSLAPCDGSTLEPQNCFREGPLGLFESLIEDFRKRTRTVDPISNTKCHIYIHFQNGALVTAEAHALQQTQMIFKSQ